MSAPSTTLYPGLFTYPEAAYDIVKWDSIGSRQFETGVDRGVLYRNDIKYYSAESIDIDALTIGSIISVGFITPVVDKFVVGRSVVLKDRVTRNTQTIEGVVMSSTSTAVSIEVASKTGTGVQNSWEISQTRKAVPWVGLTSIDETGADSAVSYYIDGRPYLYFPKPREYGANIKAYTYPEEFSACLGIVEAGSAEGMFLDSQVGDTFGFSYRTLIGNTVQGAEFAYKIHLVYNATVVVSGVTYDSIGSSINPVEFSFPIQAVPKLVEGYRATAHVIIDTRNIEPDKLVKIETMIYGNETAQAYLPEPQEIFDILAFGDTIIITDLGDGTWTAEGASSNVYLTEDGKFQIDNVNAVDNGDGTYDISSTP